MHLKKIMKSNRIIFFLALVLIFSSGGTARAEDNGGYAGAFLQIPVGARPSAMGGAYTSISNDGAGPLFNPAGISSIRQKLFSTSYRSMSIDRTLGYVTLLFPGKHNATIGVNWLHAGSGSVEARNTDGDPLGQDITFNNNAIAFVFAKRFEDYLSIGARLAYLQASLEDMSTALVSFDFGAILYVNSLFDRERRDLVPVQDIKIGLVIKNIAANYRWDGSEISGSTSGVIQEDVVPVEFRLGLSGRFLDKKLLLSTDFSKNSKQSATFHAGAEFTHLEKFFLRAGLDRGRPTAGFGYLFNFGLKTMAIDYAFSSDRVGEGSEHIFSFDILF